jgi:plasmid stability protein
MATLTIKNLPDEIYAALSRTAKLNRRSINKEALVRLEKTLADDDRDPDSAILRIRQNREKLRKEGVWLTDEFLEFAKNEGRP